MLLGCVAMAPVIRAQGFPSRFTPESLALFAALDDHTQAVATVGDLLGQRRREAITELVGELRRETPPKDRYDRRAGKRIPRDWAGEVV